MHSSLRYAYNFAFFKLYIKFFSRKNALVVRIPRVLIVASSHIYGKSLLIEKSVHTPFRSWNCKRHIVRQVGLMGQKVFLPGACLFLLFSRFISLSGAEEAGKRFFLGIRMLFSAWQLKLNYGEPAWNFWRRSAKCIDVKCGLYRALPCTVPHYGVQEFGLEGDNTLIAVPGESFWF